MRRITAKNPLRLFAITSLAVGCIPQPKAPRVGAIPEGPLARLAALEELHFAYETSPGCALSVGKGGKVRPVDWRELATNELAGGSYAVVEQQYVDDAAAPYVALKLKNSRTSKSIWVRNKGSADPAEASLQWRCAIDGKRVHALLPKQQAKNVYLATSVAGCSEISPILGGASDITFAPYEVVDVGAFMGPVPDAKARAAGKNGVYAVGVRLQAEGGSRSLTVSSTVFDRCFVPADHPAPPPSEVHALADWMARPVIEASTAPSISIHTLAAAAGIDPNGCAKEGATNLECRAPLLRVDTHGTGSFGAPRISLTHDRVVDGLRIVGGNVSASTDAAPNAFGIRTPKIFSTTTGFGKALNDALKAANTDPKRRTARAGLGFRLARPGDAGAPAFTHYMDVDVVYKMPDVVTTNEPHTHRYVGAIKTVENPAYARAKAALEETEWRVESAKIEADLAARATLFGLGSNEAAEVPASAVEAAAARLKSAKAAHKAAKATLASTPKEIGRGEQKSYTFNTKVLRRAGEVTVKVTFIPMKGGPATTLTMTAPYSASDFETNYAPEHLLKGKAAVPPSVEDTERALAESVTNAIERAAQRFLVTRAMKTDPGDLAPASRSATAMLARHAAGDRNVKVVADILETREDLLARDRVRYALQLPDDAASRCFTIVASTRDGKSPVDLSLLKQVGKKNYLTVARDARSDADAGFEVCHLDPGEHIVEVTLAKGEDHVPFLVSLYESTPGGVTDDEMIAATKGAPLTPQKGEAVALNAAGLAKPKADTTVAVVPPNPPDPRPDTPPAAKPKDAPKASLVAPVPDVPAPPTPAVPDLPKAAPPVKPEPVKPEPVKPEPAKPEPPKVEPPKPEPAKPEPPKVEPPKPVEPPKVEPPPAPSTPPPPPSTPVVIGSLYVTSEPRAMCVVGEVGQGPTPLILKVPVGTHSVVCSLDEGGVVQKRTATATVVQGKTAKVAVKFKD